MRAKRENCSSEIRVCFASAFGARLKLELNAAQNSMPFIMAALRVLYYCYYYYLYYFLY